MLQGFKQFILRGNVVDLAVAVVIGAAFTLIVTALVDGLINPLIAALFGATDLTGVGRFEINNAEFSVGLVVDAAVDFLLVAAALYFLIVLPLNKLNERRKRGQEPEPEEVSEDIALLREIRDLLAQQAGRRPAGQEPQAGDPTGV